jgi:hypothetical protein
MTPPVVVAIDVLSSPPSPELVAVAVVAVVLAVAGTVLQPEPELVAVAVTVVLAVTRRCRCGNKNSDCGRARNACIDTTSGTPARRSRPTREGAPQMCRRLDSPVD